MTDPEKMKPSMPSPDPDRVPDLPPEDQPERSDVEQRTDLDPEEQRNRPDQPGFERAEADQFQDPEAGPSTSDVKD